MAYFANLRQQYFCLAFLVAVITSGVILLTSFNLHPWNRYQQTKYADNQAKTTWLRTMSPSDPPDNEQNYTNHKINSWKESVNSPPDNELSWTCSKQLSILANELEFLTWRGNGQFNEYLVKAKGNNVERYALSCPKYRCNVTVAAALHDNEFLSKSDGVMMYISPNYFGNQLRSKVNKLDVILPKDVTWFFAGTESPQRHYGSSVQISDLTFHFDITYNSQSTLHMPYGYYLPSHPMDTKPQRNWASGKTHLIAWMASNCHYTFWPRTEFVRNLQKYLPVDMYGTCGTLTCPRSSVQQCSNLLKTYKFYLALENSECDDYITEKFWDKGLLHGVVPVVYGGRRPAYEKLAPPNSFIHVGDFKNTHELANYLLELDQDDEKYNQYFQWRLKGHVNITLMYNPNFFCDTIPLMNLKSSEKAKRRVTKSEYINSCRGNLNAPIGHASYSNWSPWK